MTAESHPFGPPYFGATILAPSFGVVAHTPLETPTPGSFALGATPLPSNPLVASDSFGVGVSNPFAALAPAPNPPPFGVAIPLLVPGRPRTPWTVQRLASAIPLLVPGRP